MSLTLRAPTDDDWPGILRAADASAPWKAAENPEWLRNRQNFPVDRLARRHYVVEDSTARAILAYGAVEEGPEAGQFRVYLVADPQYLASGIGERLYDWLLADLRQLEARLAWVRETAGDVELLAFFKERGFDETRRATLDSGDEVILLQRQMLG